MSGALDRASITWLLDEILKAKREIDAGNKDRYISGRYVALRAAACKFCRISRPDFDRYIDWLEIQVQNGARIGAVTEPSPWVRINCK